RNRAQKILILLFKHLIYVYKIAINRHELLPVFRMGSLVNYDRQLLVWHQTMGWHSIWSHLCHHGYRCSFHAHADGYYCRQMGKCREALWHTTLALCRYFVLSTTG